MVHSSYKIIDYSKLSSEEAEKLFRELGIPTREMNNQEKASLESILASARAFIEQDQKRHPEMDPKDPHCFEFWAGALQAVWTKPEFDVSFRQIFVGSFCVFSGDLMRASKPSLEYYVSFNERGLDTFGLVDRDDTGRICRMFQIYGLTRKFLDGEEGKNVAEIIPHWIRSLKEEVQPRENN